MLPEAIKRMQLFLSKNNHISKEAYLRMGNLYFDNRQYADAYVYYDKLVQSKDFFAQALLKRGLCNHHLKKMNQACTDIETAHSYGDTVAIYYLNQWCRIPITIDSVSLEDVSVDAY